MSEETWKIILSESAEGGAAPSASTSAAAAPAPKPTPEQIETAKNTKKSAESGSLVSGALNTLGIAKLGAFLGGAISVFAILQKSTIFSSFFGATMQTLAMVMDVLLIPLIPIFSLALEAMVELIPIAQTIADGMGAVGKWLEGIYRHYFPSKENLTAPAGTPGAVIDPKTGKVSGMWDNQAVTGLKTVPEMALDALAHPERAFDPETWTPLKLDPYAAIPKEYWDKLTPPRQTMGNGAPMPGGIFDLMVPQTGQTTGQTMGNGAPMPGGSFDLIMPQTGYFGTERNSSMIGSNIPAMNPSTTKSQNITMNNTFNIEPPDFVTQILDSLRKEWTRALIQGQ